MGLDTVTSYFTEKAIDKSPGWFARRTFHPDQVVVDLRRQRPVDISFGRTVPRIEVAFRIDNRSHVDLVLERLVFDLWVGQPILNGVVWQRHEVPKHQDREDVFFWAPLIPSQVEQVRQQVKNGMIEETNLEVTAYFESRIGLVTVEGRRLRQTQVPCQVPGT